MNSEPGLANYKKRGKNICCINKARLSLILMRRREITKGFQISFSSFAKYIQILPESNPEVKSPRVRFF
jgi:hypothetical protein